MAASKKRLYRNVYEAFNVIVMTLFIFGYTGFYKKDAIFKSPRWILAYTVLMPLVIAFVLVYGVDIIYNSPNYAQVFEDMDIVLLSIGLMGIIMAILSFFINIYFMYRNRFRQIKLYDNMEQLDNRLVQEFGVQMHYEKISFKISLVIKVFFGYQSLMIVLVFIFWSRGNPVTMMASTFCYTFILDGMLMVVYNFMSVADLIRIRFRLLQKLLAPTYLRRHFPDREVRASKISKAIEIYRELYEVIDELNHVYSVCLLSCLAHDFILTTSLLYLMLGRSSNLESIGDLKMFLGVLVVLLPPAYKMAMMPLYCSMSLKEGRMCMRVIKLMDDAFSLDDRVRQIVGAVLLWNNLNKVEYKIGSMITSNIGMMTMVASAIVNYIAILIQFQIQEEVSKI